MLYKFKSKATGDLIMLEPNGRRVLEIIGKAPGPQGIILPEQMQAALAALDQAVAQEEVDMKAAAAQTGGPGQGKSASESDHVGLRQRVLPFIEMLKSCAAAGEDIRWGV